jgi:Na+-driven multidrug efflux pump
MSDDTESKSSTGHSLHEPSLDANDKAIPPYSLYYETWYFFTKGVPLMIAAVLEWGVPPWVALALAGHTHDSRALQMSLGYARVFYNITTLMVGFSMVNYFATVLPGAIGAGRRDRVQRYFQRSVLYITVFWIPVVLLQIFAGDIMFAVGVPQATATDVGIYTRYMIPVGWLLMFECHLELIFVNLGYEKCSATNSLITGLGVDVLCTYFFVYKWGWGIRGVALSQLAVKASRILIWIVLMHYFKLSKYFYGTEKKQNNNKNKNKNVGDRAQLLLEALETDHRDNTVLVEHGTTENDPFFSWVEFQVFWNTVLPTLMTFFTGWLIFELQIICLGHIAGIPTAAVAAGAIWVQSESTLAAVQRGWLQVTKMRTLKLMGNNDPVGAKKAYACMCFLSFVLVSVTNIPLLVWSDDIGIVVSNDKDVRYWLNQIIWVLAIHQSSRICSINGGALYIAVERGTLKVLQNFVGFYVVASPIAAVAALTNLVTSDIATKMMFCVAATAVAQILIGIWAFLDMFCRQDWQHGSDLIAERANNDRLKKQLQQSLLPEREGKEDRGLVAGNIQDNNGVLRSPLQSPLRSPLRSPRESRAAR